MFDGIRLVVENVAVPVVDPEATAWSLGASNLMPLVSLDEFMWQGSLVHGIPSPADYRITIADRVVDTSVSMYGIDPVPMQFSVRNITEDRKVRVLFSDLDADQKLGMLDAVTIVEASGDGAPSIGWTMFFGAVANPRLPLAGDMFDLRIRKPLTVRDVFEFAVPLTEVSDCEEKALPGSVVLWQNFPNPFNPSTAISMQLTAQDRVRLRVYDLVGREVATLMDADMPPGIHTVTWNASACPSGVYFYQLKTGHRIVTRSMLLLR
jgi:hypothetical protein